MLALPEVDPWAEVLELSGYSHVRILVDSLGQFEHFWNVNVLPEQREISGGHWSSYHE